MDKLDLSSKPGNSESFTSVAGEENLTSEMEKEVAYLLRESQSSSNEESASYQHDQVSMRNPDFRKHLEKTLTKAPQTVVFNSSRGDESQGTLEIDLADTKDKSTPQRLVSMVSIGHANSFDEDNKRLIDNKIG